MDDYYELLGLKETATQSEIKKAFKSLSLKFHPDKNPSECAKAKFQQILEAYETLSNPASRADYDIICAEPKLSQTGMDNSVLSAVAIRCSCCNSKTAQPRYLIFYNTISLIFFTSKSPKQGIFCPKCGSRDLIKSSLVNMFLGWWGIPWGPIYTLKSLFVNATKGSKPALPNAYILSQQSLYFYSVGNESVSAGILMEAKKFAEKANKKMKSTGTSASERAQLRVIEQRINFLNQKLAENPRTLKSQWRSLHVPTLVIATTVSAYAFGTFYHFDRSDYYRGEDTVLSSKNANNTKLDFTTLKNDEKQPKREQKLIQKTPTIQPPPFGLSWPEQSVYVPGTNLDNLTGLSEIVIDNSRSDSPKHIKIYYLKNNTVVRQSYVRGGDKFSFELLDAGVYEIRFRDLMHDSYAKTKAVELTEEVDSSTSYTVTMYKVIGGNLKTEKISADDF